MAQTKISLHEVKGDLMTYLNWSLNALVPFVPTAADRYLLENKAVIVKVSQMLLKSIHYRPSTIYRGIILRKHVNCIIPDANLQYLSFSTDRTVAEHFADINGFGSDWINVPIQLGNYGYVIQYLPNVSEVLFHYQFLDFLPYAEALNLIGMNGYDEVEGLKLQKEITILQPVDPLTNITPQILRSIIQV
ncbi:hypothetical protein [Chitinophaga niabensis]|uniref:Uncharacterized protein n=1 Tax=Chitinophaga niabensis TaxID=536979 RepID=A0A1N6KBK3_9BACT|nr:hypothetical protein [Chitinophaga niabensis]SIO53938.1 hypothetical protein SAMN04488055_5508 [Chitinophaga niabensis]